MLTLIVLVAFGLGVFVGSKYPKFSQWVFNALSKVKNTLFK